MTRPALALAAAVAALCAGPCRADDSLARWVEGPVRYLITGPEVREFRDLRTEGARALFIERFWLRRDPTPGTLRNEYREEFWARVEDANLRFGTTVPGWKTDRGRVLLLLGWPDSVESESFPLVDRTPRAPTADANAFDDGSGGFEQEAGYGGGYRGIERWHYRNTEQQNLGPNLIVAFVRDLSDEYRIASDPSLYTARFPAAGSQFRAPIQLPGVSGLVQARPPSLSPDLPTLSGLSGLVRFELAEAVEIPDPRRLATEVVTSRDFLGLLPIRSRWLFFLSPDDGRTIVLSGLQVPGPALYGTDPPPSLVSYLLTYVSLLPEGAEEAVLADNEEAPRRVTASEAGGPLEAWTGTVTEPGTYQVAVGLLDAATGRVASLREAMKVPDFSGDGPRLSSLLLASSFPGGVAVRPPVRRERPYRPDESFLLYYELYGLAASYDVAYSFEYREADGWRLLSSPVEAGPRSPGRQGWEFPLGAFPAGRYRLTVEARDATGSGDTATVAFEVAVPAGDGGGPPVSRDR